MIEADTGPLNSIDANMKGGPFTFPDIEKVGAGAGVGVGFGFGKRCQLGEVSEKVKTVGHLRFVLSRLTVQILPDGTMMATESPSGDQCGVYESKLKSFL